LDFEAHVEEHVLPRHGFQHVPQHRHPSVGCAPPPPPRSASARRTDPSRTTSCPTVARSRAGSAPHGHRRCLRGHRQRRWRAKSVAVAASAADTATTGRRVVDCAVADCLSKPTAARLSAGARVVLGERGHCDMQCCERESERVCLSDSRTIVDCLSEATCTLRASV
jgi:hypothetical protein